MISRALLSQLESIVGAGGLLTAPEDMMAYGYDATLPEHRPEAVILPTTTQQISHSLRRAGESGTPVVPRGAGTGLSGGSLPLRGGIVLSLIRMTRIVEIDSQNLTVRVEPGVVNAHLQAALSPIGLFYPPDPASMKVCTMGGNVAMSAGGPRCLKYGSTKDYVLGLEVVLPDGEIINTGGRTVKNTTGYDLTHLFVGSEGTLGVITEITLRLLPQPEAKRTMLAIFDDLDDASRTVSAIVAEGILPTTLEMMDSLLIQCAEDFTGAGLPRDAAAILLIEVDGFEEAMDRQVTTIKRVCAGQGVREVRVATSAQEVDDLWLARRTIIGAVARRRPSMVLQDVTVPPAQLPEMVARVVDIGRQYKLPIGVLAHAGDGNLHPIILFDQRDDEEMAHEREAEAAIFALSLEMDGTLTGEHGIGLTKRKYLPQALNSREMELTRGLKTLLDPQGILNPGKIVGGDNEQLA